LFLTKTTSSTSLAVPGRNDEDGEIDLQLNKPHTKANSAKAGDAKPGI